MSLCDLNFKTDVIKSTLEMLEILDEEGVNISICHKE